MTPGPEASDDRTSADNSLRRTKKLSLGHERQSTLDQAEDDEAQAHSSNWRRSHLHAPD
jgi:hypothetical protein